MHRGPFLYWKSTKRTETDDEVVKSEEEESSREGEGSEEGETDGEADVYNDLVVSDRTSCAIPPVNRGRHATRAVVWLRRGARSAHGGFRATKCQDYLVE